MRLLLVAGLVFCACTPKTEVELFVDGFQPRNVRFEVEERGVMDQAAITALAARGDMDGALRLPEGSCQGPCRVALVTVFLTNRADAPEPVPVVRLKSPPGRPPRAPIAYRGGEISPGRIGRIRWLVELWPEETSLTATVSASVQLVAAPGEPAPAPATAAPAPATAAPAPATAAPSPSAGAPSTPAPSAPAPSAPSASSSPAPTPAPTVTP